MVARLLWEQDAAGSNPVTSTSPSVHMNTRIFLSVKVSLRTFMSG